eukprot:s2575_g4.t1
MLSQLAVLAVLFASGDCFRSSTDLESKDKDQLFQECEESQTSPEHFSELRSNAFVTQCSKRDVCFLMRQLDAYFYARALKGELVDYGKPGGRFVASGNCKRPLSSKKLVPVTTKEECKEILSKHTKKKMRVISSTKYPAGCILDFITKRGRFNKADSNVDAGVKYIQVGKSGFSAQRRKVDIRQYCYDDYSLDEAAASYYSPYKLKESMAGRPEMSTSCSFGMMAGLSKVGLTDSPCASILVGEQGTKAKNVLIEQITNHWCPGIWHEAMENRATCSADRFPSWAKHGFVRDEDEEGIVERAEYLLRGIGGETKESLMANRTAKMGLPEGVCEGIEDELFDGILSGKGDEAPDFFRDAMVK